VTASGKVEGLCDVGEGGGNCSRKGDHVAVSISDWLIAG